MASHSSTPDQAGGSPLGSDSSGLPPPRRPFLPPFHSLLTSDPSVSPPLHSFFQPAGFHAPRARTPTDFVDLTNDSDSSEPAMPSSGRHGNGEPARKRRRVADPQDPPASSSRAIDVDADDFPAEVPTEVAPLLADDSDEIEEVDLSHVHTDMDLKKHQAEQRRRHLEMEEQQNQLVKDSVAAQQSESSGPASLSRLSCIICMESMTDMTATHCGHVFCHTCIMEALIAGERQGHEPGKGLSRCPVCRKKVIRSEGKTKDPQQVIPLELKFIRRSDKAKGKQRETEDA